jgi:hypothetical protein
LAYIPKSVNTTRLAGTAHGSVVMNRSS